MVRKYLQHENHAQFLCTSSEYPALLQAWWYRHITGDGYQAVSPRYLISRCPICGAAHSAKVDDRKPIPKLVNSVFGKLFADKGYLSQPLFESLLEQGVQLITGLRTNMKNRLMLLTDKLLLRKRFIIETVNDQLKNQSQIEHSRHRSPVNFVVNVIAGLIAYMWQPKQPAIHWSAPDAKALAFVR